MLLLLEGGLCLPLSETPRWEPGLSVTPALKGIDYCLQVGGFFLLFPERNQISLGFCKSAGAPGCCAHEYRCNEQ